MIALCLDVSLAATGYAVVHLPLAYDTRTGIWPNPALHCGELPTGPKDGLIERAGLLGLAIEALIRAHNPAVIAAEAPPNRFQALGRESRGNAQTDKMVTWAYAVVATTAWRLGVPYLSADPKDTKRAVAGNANAKKQDIALALRRLHGIGTRGAKGTTVDWPPGWGSDNVRDAIVVGHWLDGMSRNQGANWLDVLLDMNGERPAADWATRHGTD